MTVSATWFKAILLIPLLLAACQNPTERAALIDSRPLPSPRRQPPVAGSLPAVPELPPGLTPLLTPEQVLTAQPIGRLDPFAPLPGLGGSRTGLPATPAPAALPQGFRFNGVVRSGELQEALVQLGDDSGSLRVGDVGGRSTRLLPPGWVVRGIDVVRGRLLLRAAGQLVTLRLDPAGQDPAGQDQAGQDPAR